MIGASLVAPEKLFFGIFGDLAFFYDLNSLGNRHVGKNLRILLVNNGKGTEFRNYSHHAERFGNDADAFMAAAGHFGKQSRDLVKHYSEDLGFQYLSASTKEEFQKAVTEFISPENIDKSIIFEVFTDSQLESNALKILASMEHTVCGSAKKVIRKMCGAARIQAIKKFLKK